MGAATSGRAMGSDCAPDGGPREGASALATGASAPLIGIGGGGGAFAEFDRG